MLPRLLLRDDEAALAGGLRPGAALALDERHEHYLLRVLRLRRGDPLEIFDGRGRCHRATIDEDRAGHCSVLVGDPVERRSESPLRIELAQCVPTGDKMDWVIEKAVELGASAIRPLQSARGQVKLDAARAARRTEHWQRVAEAACMQCRRDVLPEVRAPEPLARWLASLDPAADVRRIVLDPEAGARLSALGVASDRPVLLLVGPESGFDTAELDAARRAGFESASLGPRVLRTETAGLAALAALQALAGDL